MEKFLKIFFAISFLTPCLEARQPYQATVSVGVETATVSDPNLVDLTRNLRTVALKELFPFYTPISPLDIDINIRGIIALGSFAAGSQTFVVEIPQTNSTEIFAGATRDASLILFKDYVRDAGIGHRLLKAYALYSPIDPIAGNPNCLISLMGQADYLMGHLSPLSRCDPCWSSQPIRQQVQMGTYAGRSFSGGFDTTVVSLPLRFSYAPHLQSAFIVDAPLSYLRNGGASSVVGSIGFGCRIAITAPWSLTPIVRGGIGGSLDLCTAGSFVSTGLTSVYNLNVNSVVLSITNYAGYLTSTNLWLSGVNFNYNLHNYIFKNGFELTTCHLFKWPIDLKLTFVDTCFAKDRLYMNHYDEVGFYVVSSCINPLAEYDHLMVGFSYQFGERGYHGYFGQLLYQF